MKTSTIYLIVNIFLVLFLGSCRTDPEDQDIKKEDTIKVDSTLFFSQCVPSANDENIYHGCHNIFLAKSLTAEEIEYVVVSIDPEKVAVTDSCRSYALPIEGIAVSLLRSKQHPDSVYFNFCTDVFPENLADPITYNLTQGEILIGASIDSVLSNSKDFDVSVLLKNLQFSNNIGDTIIHEVLFNKIPQGWDPG